MSDVDVIYPGQEDSSVMPKSASANRWVLLVASVMAALPCASATALIISTNQPLSNTEGAAGFPYWDNVGWRGTRTGDDGINGDGSCVYLGDSWVLTANHVNPGNVILNGVTYAAIDGTSRRIDSIDARVFRIANPSPAGVGMISTSVHFISFVYPGA